MMTVHDFDPSHVSGVRGVPLEIYSEVFDEFFCHCATRPENKTWTVRDGNSTVFVGGVVPRGDGLAGWGVFTEKARHHHVLGVHRVVRNVIAEGGRIEIDLDPEFRPGIRWAEMLGFDIRWN